MCNVSSKTTLIIGILTIFITLLMCPAQGSTEETADTLVETEKKEVDPEAEALNKLGKWWRKNPRKYDPTPRWLAHTEFDFNFLYDSGNLDRNVTLLKGLFVLRKEVVSNYLSWDYQDRHAERYGEELRDVTAYEVHDSIRYSLTDSLIARAGIIMSSNDELGYDLRLTSYGGLGVRPVEKEYAILSIFGGAGYEYQEYSDDVEDIAERTRHLGIFEAFESGEYDSPITYFHEQLFIFFSERTGFEQSLELINYLDDMDEFRLKFTFGMEVGITDYLKLVPTYTVDYNSNPLPWVDDSTLRLTKKTDTAITVNIRLSL